MMENGLSLLALKQPRTLDCVLRKRIEIWVFGFFHPASLVVGPITQTKTD
jgi:hypothetical protein